VAILAAMGLAGGLPADAHSCGHHRCGNCIQPDGDWCRGCGGHWRSARGTESLPRAPWGPAGDIRAGLQSREGKVAEVNYLPGATPETAMVEIRLAAGTEQVLVRLGPAGFLGANQVRLREGDSILVTGYWVMGGDGRMLVATQVTVNGRAVQLRDGRGRPAW
jgi:hypothetical protein